MTVKTILLTSDDGYNSAGTRVLVNCLKEKYQLTITGTTEQQSGVGGRMSLKNGFNYGVTEVDGVKAIWVDGTPVDSSELMACYPGSPFDLVISGINWGVNLGAAVSSSGTFNAAIGAIRTGVTKKAIAMSWDLPGEFYLKHHDNSHSITEYIEYPGKLAGQVIELVIQNDFWGADLLNVNFPYQPSNKIMLTELALNVKDIYDFSEYHFKETGDHYLYTANRKENLNLKITLDVQAVNDGYISITPCKFDFMNDEVVKKVIGQIIEL